MFASNFQPQYKCQIFSDFLLFGLDIDIKTRWFTLNNTDDMLYKTLVQSLVELKVCQN